MEKDILEEKPEHSKNEGPNKVIYYSIGTFLLLVLIIVTWWVFSRINSTPTVAPSVSPTEQVWRTRSQANVSKFIDFYQKSQTATNPAEYADKAIELLTNEAKTKLPTYKDSRGRIMTDVPDQLFRFVNIDPGYLASNLQSSEQIDADKVAVQAVFDYNGETKTYEFNLLSEGGIWLIDEVKLWEPTPNPLPSSPQS